MTCWHQILIAAKKVDKLHKYGMLQAILTGGSIYYEPAPALDWIEVPRIQWRVSGGTTDGRRCTNPVP